MTCRRNEFADLLERQEPKFAQRMRQHGKQAVLKDDEVDRLERSAAATSGTSRQDVMESMYGRLSPKPRGEPQIAVEQLLHDQGCMSDFPSMGSATSKHDNSDIMKDSQTHSCGRHHGQTCRLHSINV